MPYDAGMSMFPESTVETPYGRLSVWATSASHIGFRTEWAHNWRREGPAPVETLTASRVEYSFRADLSPMVEQDPQATKYGERLIDLGHGWAISADNLNNMLTRKNWQDYNKSKGTAAADAEIRAKLLPLLAEFAAGPEGRALLDVAERQRREARAEGAREAVEKARRELAAAELALAESDAERTCPTCGAVGLSCECGPGER